MAFTTIDHYIMTLNIDRPTDEVIQRGDINGVKTPYMRLDK